MGTRSDIIVKLADGNFTRVYCHWDGHPETNGRTLIEHHNSQQLAERIVAPGDLSALREKSGGTKKIRGHTFDKPKSDYSIYYGRDRGEKGTERKVFDNLSAAWPGDDCGTEYTYVWNGETWLVGDPDEGTQSLVPLADVLAGKVTIHSAVKAFGGNFVIGKH